MQAEKDRLFQLQKQNVLAIASLAVESLSLRVSIHCGEGGREREEMGAEGGGKGEKRREGVGGEDGGREEGREYV